jgi:redox-sensitive bicupin YhaK (pirin superfamily)
MTKPRYQEIASEEIPEIERQDGVRIRVIAGLADGVRGPVREIVADPTYLDASIPAGGSFRQPVERGHSAFAYIFEGAGTFGLAGDSSGETVSAPKLVVLKDGDYVQVRTDRQAVRFLLISGKPLHEPIARYGPFVMNTWQEIEQTLRELRDGTFIRAEAS